MNNQRLLPVAILILLNLAFAMDDALASKHIRLPQNIAMRDGKTLAADVYLQINSAFGPSFSSKHPMTRKTSYSFSRPNLAMIHCSRAQNTSLWWSIGEDSTRPWRQPFRVTTGVWTVTISSSGSPNRVGATIMSAPKRGPSALAFIQFQTASKHPPHLIAATPIVGHMRDTYELYYPGGVYARNKNSFVAGHFGTGDMMTSHPIYDLTWQYLEGTGIQASQIDIPMLFMSGWYDHETAISLQVAADIQANGGPNARGRQKVLVGPWSHGGIGKVQQGEIGYPQAEQESSRLAKEFFDFYLRGIANGYESRPMFRTFTINESNWRDASSWPSDNQRITHFFPTIDRTLDTSPPITTVAKLSYTSDPSNPVPTLFGAILIETNATQGPGNLAGIESRQDGIPLSTPPLSQPLTIEGSVLAKLWIECSAVDTDISVRMTDVWPDGRSMLLVDGIRRASCATPIPSANFQSRTSLTWSPSSLLR